MMAEGTRWKYCPVCREGKPPEEFYADRAKASGLRSPCKPCDLEKARRYYAANRDRKLAAANARNARLRARREREAA